MPSEQNIQFFTANKAEIDKLIRGINKPRQVEGYAPLTNDEVDAIITALVTHCSGGGEIADFQPDVPEPVRPERPVQLPREESDPNAIVCIFTPCKNGYVVKVKGENYIFKSEEELMEVIRGLFFPSWEDLDKKINKHAKLKAVSKATS